MSMRDLPAVHKLADSLASELPAALQTDIARQAIDKARSLIAGGTPADADEIASALGRSLEQSRNQPIVNATGVLLHTNLGRAPLHPEAAEAAKSASSGYSNVEIDLSDGTRGGRGSYLNLLIEQLTGAQAALVVNNCAAALLVTLTTLARNKEVPVSRGELIEIGGSYRLPELMSATGAQLKEVGTTNRTRVGDYANAVTEDTGLLLKVHPSNYQVVGFSEEATLKELAELSRSSDIPLVHDLGSGLLSSTPSWLPSPPPAWVSNEPSVTESLAHANLVMFSGDKLLGGPQAGIIVGDAQLIGLIKKHPMHRALRVDGGTMAALTTTLELYLDGRASELPFWEMAQRSYESLSERLSKFSAGEVRDGLSTVGGGSAPGSTIASPLLFVPNGDTHWDRLLNAPRPVLARREKGELVIDLRTVAPSDDQYISGLLAN